MVSNHADTEAYAFLLRAFKRAVIRAALDYLAGRIRLTIEGVTPERLRHECTLVAHHGFTPAFMMIDGCDAERKAIETVWPGMPLRACQFHLMQACRSKVRKYLHKHKNVDQQTTRILDAIRLCQRCPSPSLWPEYYQRLGDTVNSIAEDQGQTWEGLKDYLDREWFSDRWRKYVVDFGLPFHVTRDGPWSTNNYSEASFRTFDRVFLSCQANKRRADPYRTRPGG